MKRVVIIGSPGAGKTTFSRKLAQKTGLPLIHLDYYYHQTRFNYYEDKDAWREKVKELITKDKWIIEGNYSSTYDLRFVRANCIILLEISSKKAVYRILKRHIKQRGKPRPEMPPEWEEKIEKGFLGHVWGFNKKEIPKISKELDNHKNKELIFLKNPKQADEYLKCYDGVKGKPQIQRD